MEEFQTKPPWCSFEMLKTRAGAPVGSFTYDEWKENTPEILKATKKKIEPLEKCHLWELAKKMANPYELIYTLDDKFFHPSISAIKPLSRSYFKLIEMLNVMQFFERLPKQTQNVVSAHIAEGPGGFIQAFLDASEKAKKRVAHSYSMTLNPTNQHIPGWKRATTFLQKNPMIKLTYGADNTGDIYKKVNQESFAKLTRGACHLYTADGGFDFSVNYEKQEQTIFSLVVSSFLIGLKSLRLGGTMIVKLFDVYSEHNQILVAMMGRQFQEWTLYKPLTSRACNSERYFIGSGYRGLNSAIYASLEEIEKASFEGLYPSNADYLEEYERTYFAGHIERSTKYQLEAIERALRFSENPDQWYDEYFMKSFNESHAWCRYFHIPSTIHVPRALCRIHGTKGVPLPYNISSTTDHRQSSTPDVD